MSRLIDADAFLAEESEAFMAVQLKIKDDATKMVNEFVHKKVQMLIADAPTVDAVPVVRCGDCKFFHTNDGDRWEWRGVHHD